MKLKYDVNCIMPARCLYENGDSSEVDALMKNIFWRKKESHLNVKKRKHIFILTMVPHLPSIAL